MRRQNAWLQLESGEHYVKGSIGIQAALNLLRQHLAEVSETAGLDAQVLLADLLAKPRSWVLAHPEYVLSVEEAESLTAVSARLAQNEPVPYILGFREFYGLKLAVSPAVLIPRPETELLVEQALNWLTKHPGLRLAADVGTGSGCIAVSLAANHDPLRIIATELSTPALRVAQRNISSHCLSEQIWLVQCDLLHGIAGPFDLICANLPYIPTRTLEELPVKVWEPRPALWGGSDGLEQISSLLRSISDKLTARGLLLLEIESSQGAATYSLVRNALPGAAIQIIPDLAGHDRLISAQN